MPRAPRSDKSGPVSTILATWTAELLAREVPSHKDRARILRRAAIDPAALAARDARLDHDAACALWELVTAEHPDPIVGIHFAQGLTASSLGVVGYLAMSSATALDALHRVGSYHSLVKGDGAVTIEERHGEVRIVDGPGPDRSPWARHLAEAVIFAYRFCIEQWSARTVIPRKVRFQHRAPRESELVERAFGCRVTFGAPVNEIIFATADLRVPFVTRDAALVEYLSPVADQLLDALPHSDTLLGSVERAIRLDLPSGDISLGHVAHRLGVGERTLQRRLRDRSLSFQEIVDRVRRTAATRLLDDPGLGLEDVAFLLGYADTSSFRRAHKRWTGRTPRGASKSGAAA
jgi:AraC-like DNA-binding protein